MKSQNGFTLIEVLIALVIIAIAFSTTYLILGKSSHDLIRLQNKTASQWVGMNVIAKVQRRFIIMDSFASSTKGAEVMFNESWDWSVTINASDVPNVAEIKVSVTRHASANVITELTGYMFRATT